MYREHSSCGQEQDNVDEAREEKHGVTENVLLSMSIFVRARATYLTIVAAYGTSCPVHSAKRHMAMGSSKIVYATGYLSRGAPFRNPSAEKECGYAQKHSFGDVDDMCVNTPGRILEGRPAGVKHHSPAVY